MATLKIMQLSVLSIFFFFSENQLKSFPKLTLQFAKFTENLQNLRNWRALEKFLSLLFSSSPVILYRVFFISTFFLDNFFCVLGSN